jgi:nitroimidazol reductase NimA-like FMN-containing flavoprotein (pyridoxamine 5'-phosphate oxidase superfamily)
MTAGIDRRTGLESLDRDECLALMRAAGIGRIAVVMDGRALVFPVNFTLDGDAVVLRTAPGTKLHAARNGPVAFECDGTDTTYHTGWSVLAVGDAVEVTNGADVRRLERLPLAPWCDAPKPVWLRIAPRTLTGRRIPPHGRPPEEGE